MHHKLALLLCASSIISGMAAGDVVSYSFPSFNATTTVGLVVATNSSVLTPASILFEPDRQNAEFNRTEGFLLLSRTVDVWRAGAGGEPALEASFNTSFTLGGANPAVSFVVLLDSIPVSGGLTGAANYTSSLSAGASSRLAAVEVGSVTSYGPYYQDVGLNVTVTPRGAAVRPIAVWVVYGAGEHSLSVHVAAAGEPRPSKALLDAPLSLAGRRTTETAFVGFFAATVRDVIVAVRDWNLTVDRFPGDGVGNNVNKTTAPCRVALLAVLGSVAATTIM